MAASMTWMTFCRLKHLQYANKLCSHGLKQRRILTKNGGLENLTSISSKRFLSADSGSDDTGQNTDGDGSKDHKPRSREVKEWKEKKTKKKSEMNLDFVRALMNEMMPDADGEEKSKAEKKVNTPAMKMDIKDGDILNEKSKKKKKKMIKFEEIRGMVDDMFPETKTKVKTEDSAESETTSEKPNVENKDQEFIDFGVDEVLTDAVDSISSKLPRNKSRQFKDDLLRNLQENAKLTKEQKATRAKQRSNVSFESMSSFFDDVEFVDEERKPSRRRQGFERGQERRGPMTKSDGYRHPPAGIYQPYAMEDRPERRFLMKMSEAEELEHIKRWKDYFSDSKNTLGVFSAEDMKTLSKTEQPTYDKTLWDVIWEEDKTTVEEAMQRSRFDEHILLTKQGKMWEFPINNDQGWDEENVSFADHVFLDHLLEDFPSKGPVRHFIELVTTGLSQNPYLTVEQKHEHIEWFRNYFKENQETLIEALGDAGKFSEITV